MYPIYASKLALVLSLSTVRLSPQFHVSFDTYFTTINGNDGNSVPLRYWQAMCGITKVDKLVFMHSEHHDP